jgi:hypothetical protein
MKERIRQSCSALPEACKFSSHATPVSLGLRLIQAHKGRSEDFNNRASTGNLARKNSNEKAW